MSYKKKAMLVAKQLRLLKVNYEWFNAHQSSLLILKKDIVRLIKDMCSLFLWEDVSAYYINSVLEPLRFLN